MIKILVAFDSQTKMVINHIRVVRKWLKPRRLSLTDRRHPLNDEVIEYGH
jgi:hypothetical protein